MAATLKQVSILFAGVLCFLSFLGTASSATTPKFIVEGEVFCEVCRINFINRLSQPMSDATVRVQCRGEEKGNLTYTLDGVTDASGKYRLVVEGDHGEEECEVTLVKSGREDCQVLPNEGWAMKPSSQVTITKNSGFHDNVRQANPLGFTLKKAAAECDNLFKELQINPLELI